MNWFANLLFYVLNIRNEGDLCDIERVFLLQNDFWCADQNQIKTEEKLKTKNSYLSKIGISLERENGFVDSFDVYPEKCYSLKSTNLGYFVLKNTLKKAIESFLNSPKDDHFFLKFIFSFIDKQIKNPRVCNKIQDCGTYKLLEKVPENKSIVNLKSDGIDIRLKHIKKRFKGFIEVNLVRFNEYMKILGTIEKEEGSKIEDFNLFFFENHSKCIKTLKKFIKNLRYFKLLDDGLSDCLTAEFHKIFINKTSTLNVSDFRELLWKKFVKNLKKVYGKRIDETWEELFEECCDYLESLVLNNKIYFLVGGNYDFKYYIKQFSNIFYDSTKEIQAEYAIATPEIKTVISTEIINLLRINFKNLQIRIMKDLCVSEYVHKHFSKVLKRKIKTLDDYVEVEKMVCDYYNMFVYIVNLYNGFTEDSGVSLNNGVNEDSGISLHNNFTEDSGVSYSYVSPIYIDNFNLKIIDGVKIEFNYFDKYRKIQGFDDKGVEIDMEENIDYFIDESGVLYCPSDVLKMKNIQEIEVNSSYGKNSMRLKDSEFLLV